MASEGHRLPGCTDSESTKPVAPGNILESCRTVEELERLTSQYAMISELLRGLPQESCDKNMAAKFKNELVEIEGLLQSLSAATKEAEELKTSLKEMMSDIKKHIWQNMDNYLCNVAQQSSKRGLMHENRGNTPSENGVRLISDACPTSGLEEKPSSRDGRVLFSDIDRGNVENQGPTEHRKEPPVSTNVSAEELRRVPDNLRGRLTVEKINETLNMLRDVTQRKYRLLKKRKGLTIAEKDALIRMRSEIVPAVRECHFISEEDVYFFTQKRLPRATMNQLAVLRHLQKIREVRDKNILRIVLRS